MFTYNVGDKVTVLAGMHGFDVGEEVEVANLTSDGFLECVNDAGVFQYMIPTELRPIGLSLFDLLADQPLPAPLASHFKHVGSILELFENIPHDYALQCIREVPLTPLERAALGCLLTQYQDML